MLQETEEIIKLPLSPINQSESPRSLSPSLSRVYSRTMIKSMEDILSQDSCKDPSENKKSPATIRRSVTLKDMSDFKFSRRSTSISFERIKVAKLKVDEAIQKGKIFAVLGPYSRVREVLRNRGWVEKFFLNTDSLNNPSTRKSRSSTKSNSDKNFISDDGDDTYDDADDDDIDDDDGDGDDPNSNGLPPWEEEDGIYGIMSRMLKNIQPNLFWTLRKGQVDYKNLRKDQIINHHGKAGTFTTKTGLAKCLSQLRWFDDKEPDEFFPRCFTISTQEEKHAFIDDFHFTACASLIKEIIDDGNDSCVDREDVIDSINNSATVDIVTSRSNKKILPKIKYCDKRRERNGCISHKFLDMAIAYCEFIMKIKSHEDIDRHDFIFCWSCDWEEFLTNYYKVVHDGFRVEGACNEHTRKRCSEIAQDLKNKFPQFDMEGSRNVWILKPGAKSRGRGITCYSRLNDVLKLLTNSCVANENKFIVQKYIERPLLIYNTKFDIRQWFMVTDWNPLTVWWYKDCYLRFCSQQYTLDDFNEAVHLSNNSIQHKYHNGPRSELLPPENMWDWVQFEQWMKVEGYGNAYRSIILPGMKEAVIDVLLCVQDSVEWRKNTFELYGADFMVSENDLKPWLIEINSSPCMSPSTPITARLTTNVLEDVFKVVLDRRDNKQCETGRFELVYKQNAIFVPPYIGIDLKLAGTSIKIPTVSTILSERRSSIKHITDSFIFHHSKPKEDRPILRRNVNETSLTSSASTKKDSVSKVAEKQNIYHKRSSTSFTLNSSQVRMKSTDNKLSLSTPGPPSSTLKKLVSPNLNSKNDLNNDKAIISRKNKSPLIVAKPSKIADDVSFITTTKSLDENIEVPVLIEDSPTQHSESRDNSNLSAHSIIASKLPIVRKFENFTKSSTVRLERQYKLPTKVELVNFSLAKKMISTSLKETNIKKKRKNSKLLKRPINSQIFIQNYSLAKLNTSCNSYYRLFDKTVNYRRVLSTIDDNALRSNNDNNNKTNRSKTAISTILHPNLSTLLSKRNTNNNHVTLINFSTPLMY